MTIITIAIIVQITISLRVLVGDGGSTLRGIVTILPLTINRDSLNRIRSFSLRLRTYFLTDFSSICLNTHRKASCSLKLRENNYGSLTFSYFNFFDRFILILFTVVSMVGNYYGWIHCEEVILLLYRYSRIDDQFFMILSQTNKNKNKNHKVHSVVSHVLVTHVTDQGVIHYVSEQIQILRWRWNLNALL